ncbi:MAG: FecR domain-containing protein [Brachymonas sp.]|nr:FecR domain-containing protein [Brachymonas sp.]
MRQSLNLKQTALIAALASAYPLQAMANAGVTQFSVGDVTVQRASANTPLASGSRIESGDLITTGTSGRTQLRFTDGGMVSLQPNSQFKISRYADAGDGKQDSFLVDLARGGMRALTGLIGKRNRDNYKVTTSTATIGIRGSGFSMAYNSDGTLSVTTEQDAIEVCTQGGCIGLNLGESALVTSAGALPRRVEKRAVWNPPNPRRLVSARNDDVDSEGKTATVPRQVFTNLAFTGAGLSPEGSANIRGYIEGAALVEGGVLQGFRARNNDQGDSGTVTELARTGSIADGDFMLLGTWQAANWSGANPATLAQSGFVIGQPTPENAFAAASGLRGKYDLVAGTPVYSSAGASGTLLPSSNVMVDFRSAGRQLDINLDVQMGSNQEVSASLPINYYGGLLNMRGTATTSGSGFSSSLNIVDTYSGDTEGAGTAYGFFGGPQAGSLGLSFTGNTQSYGALAGAGVFSREPNSITDQNVDSLGYRLHVLDGSDHFLQMTTTATLTIPL